MMGSLRLVLIKSWGAYNNLISDHENVKKKKSYVRVTIETTLQVNSTEFQFMPQTNTLSNKNCWKIEHQLCSGVWQRFTWASVLRW